MILLIVSSVSLNFVVYMYIYIYIYILYIYIVYIHTYCKPCQSLELVSSCLIILFAYLLFTIKPKIHLVVAKFK